MTSFRIQRQVLETSGSHLREAYPHHALSQKQCTILDFRDGRYGTANLVIRMMYVMTRKLDRWLFPYCCYGVILMRLLIPTEHYA
ncbi:uncharacterized protein BO72DRAFT_196222 [Aspergillus fijiensis CBS 313.89]|uniref:Uncharacterized protein n=1 Tax=Aspergillus fijiensis CBS 313.89 TaxID=1448319 RepID=A0A8G1RJV4_9EURO|nr:uncharacterized protein BO72DRAFT_196222 [Aspergillus fijiensis CBS 313.89]RAK74615.1 hypothetical protein BO72DRAFT_196222 [Aspergillus fijiensis CBS 313.89]